MNLTTEQLDAIGRVLDEEHFGLSAREIATEGIKRLVGRDMLLTREDALAAQGALLEQAAQLLEQIAKFCIAHEIVDEVQQKRYCAIAERIRALSPDATAALAAHTKPLLDDLATLADKWERSCAIHESESIEEFEHATPAACALELRALLARYGRGKS